ncbi:glucan biosynthesis protein [Rudaea sp. 3F27F6]|uniref:glucan biosynthesis protein n=1 Tax=Rudaea sp. 3F27F6 TaxID=2502208 RepID=UPI0010F74773|nr:glucan biosynthesis protein [Rudaea sp. 3F27F6]
MIQRRRAILAIAAALAFAKTPRAAARGQGRSGAAAPTPPIDPLGALHTRDAQPYSYYEGLVETARKLAAADYVPPPVLPGDVMERIGYEEHSRIRYKSDKALFLNGPGAYPITFFHVGHFFRVPVRMFVAQGGQAREIVFDRANFDMRADSPAHELPADVGFAGFHVQASRLAGKGKLNWRDEDWAAFLGASYFRAMSGELSQYGTSARGVAVNTAVTGRSEEFPVFTRFYFEVPARDDDELTICALLEGPSIAGAYRFRLRRERAVHMEVEAALFLRKDVERLGLAPLTSMYWYSETIKSTAVDWRPEVHDSDGLSMWNGRGERIWRPLINPPHTTASAFLDKNPKGYGLLQRDRNFDHYLDGVFYERRPSVWVEPIGSWGPGAVQLIELPTDVESNDNIVAMWVPQEPARAGASYRLHYRLLWTSEEPAPMLAPCVSTRLGRGGKFGQEDSTRVVVEFLGGPLASLSQKSPPLEDSIWISRGQISYHEVEAVPDGAPGHWRIYFDIVAGPGAPIDMRVCLRSGEKQLTETWLYTLNL